MKYLALITALLSLVIGCSDRQASQVAAPVVATADINAGKAIAEAQCKGCHGLDGRAANDEIPHLAKQTEEYLYASLLAYKEGKRTHAALRDMAAHMSDADMRNVVAYYAGLPALPAAPGEKVPEVDVSDYEKGKVAAAACVTCHQEAGNSKTPGMPSLAGQHPVYLIAAMQAYKGGSRNMPEMKAALHKLNQTELENIALYYALQTPKQAPVPTVGDAVAGEPLTANCGGCHGLKGVSTDPAVPSLAGQDAQYLKSAAKLYKDGARRLEVMHKAVAAASEKELEDIAAFYAMQQPAAPKVEKTVSVQQAVEICDHCHGPGNDNPAIIIPKLDGQNKGYLIKALREYRDDQRRSSMMHKMSMFYNDPMIEQIATVYAGRPKR